MERHHPGLGQPLLPILYKREVTGSSHQANKARYSHLTSFYVHIWV
jgi:hypothetical protein